MHDGLHLFKCVQTAPLHTVWHILALCTTALYMYIQFFLYFILYFYLPLYYSLQHCMPFITLANFTWRSVKFLSIHLNVQRRAREIKVRFPLQTVSQLQWGKKVNRAI